MKTCILYGFIIALADALLILVLYFLGLHSDAAKLQMAGWIGGFIGIAIAITFTVIGVKVRRTEFPANEPFGYGRALWASVLISLVASVLSAIFNYVYYALINPGLFDLMIQAQLDKMQAKGISGHQAENAQRILRFMLTPGIYTVYGFVSGMIFAVILSLVIAAFLKRPGQADPPIKA
jgi:hypothetical protein